MKTPSEDSGLRPNGDDIILPDEERQVIVDALHILSIMAKPPANGAVKIWLDIARKFEGVDKRIIVRTMR